jgi:GNAT superfamily N-acetyltransferase
MISKEVEDFESLEFEQSLDIYKSSFPSNETRSIEKVVAMLKADKDYHLFITKNNSSVVGISLLYVFRSLNIGLLDYMAVAPNWQRRGIGKDLFRFTLQWCNSQTDNIIGLLMEIQKENVPDLRESLIRKNRISFYAGLGAKVLDGVNYLLPSQDNGEPEEMYLMFAPLTELDCLLKSCVIQYVSMIYSRIYHYKDNNVLNITFSNLPSVIMLRDIG